jgi:hypothetical protein
MTPFAISNSRIEAFDCPHYFRLKYFAAKDKVKDESVQAVNLLVGKLMHEVIERYVRSLKERKLNADMETLESSLRDSWNENRYIPESMFEDIREALVQFGEKHVVDPDKVAELEMRVALNWDLQPVEWYAKDVWLRAVLDRVDLYAEAGHAIIRDYKTNYHVPSEAKLRTSKQTQIYPWVLSILNPYLKKISVVYDFVRYNTQHQFDFVVPEDLTVEDELRRFTKRVIDRVARSDKAMSKLEEIAEWPATASSICAICVYDCPLLKKGKTDILRTLDDARKLADTLFVLDKRRLSIKKELATFAKAADTEIITEGGKWLHVLSESWKGIDVEDVVNLCLEKGFPLKNVVSLSSKVKDIEDEEIRDAIKAMAHVDQYTSFKFVAEKKTGDEDGG